MKKVLSIILVMLLSLSFATAAYANDGEFRQITVDITKTEMAENPASAIENALAIAKGDDSIRLTVNVPSGKYTLTKGLHIYSNTTLNLQSDTTLVRDFSSGNLLKAGTYKDITSGYDGFKNITVSGGVWDNSYTQKTCGMRFAHCQNVVIKNLTVKNIYDSHHIEIGAADGMTLDGVTLTGYKRSENTSGEAVQIDVVHEEKHFKSYTLDDTPCKNITVKNCTFKNVFSGVGTRSGVIGSYFYNIKILNNTFTNITDKAICTFNYVNSQIKNNTITNASVGIFFEEYPTKNLTSKLYMPLDKNASTKVITDINTMISGNDITVKKVASYVQSCGIGVYGGILSKSTAGKTGLKNAKYLVNNIKIKNNKITVKTAASRGMELKYVNDSTVSGNTVSSTKKLSKDNNALMLYHCSGDSLSNNSISGKFYSGISLHAGTAGAKVTSNTVKSAQTYALYIYGNSDAVVNPNTFSKNGKGTIYIKDKGVPAPVIGGRVSVKKGNGRNAVYWRKSKTASGYYVYRSAKKDGEYKLVATLKNRKLISYFDKTNKKYYYKVAPYRVYNHSVITGKKATQK